MRYQLDTNVLSDLVRNPAGRVAARIRSVGKDAVFTSIVAAAELRFGAAKKASPRLAAQVEAVLSRLDVIALDPPADRTYAALRSGLERAGTPIGANDMLIAAHAIALGCTVVTGNDDEFGRVSGLSFDNWLRSA